MELTQQQHNQLQAIINDLYDNELLQLVSELNGWSGCLEHLRYFSMEDINELYHGIEPLEILQRAFYGDFNPNHEYFGWDGYGNLISTSESDIIEEIKEYPSDIIDAICYTLGHCELPDTIQSFFDELEEQE